MITDLPFRFKILDSTYGSGRGEMVESVDICEGGMNADDALDDELELASTTD